MNDDCRRKRQLIQRNPVDNYDISEVPPIVNEVLRSSGQSLDSNTLEFMESRFGHDFSKVRVHTNSNAEESADALNAKAYTLGQDIVFGPGQYQTTSEGKKLLEHELSHIVQKSSEPQRFRNVISRKPNENNCGNHFKYEFRGVINNEKTEDHRGVPRMYYSEIPSSKNKGTGKTVEALIAGTELDVGQKAQLWRAVCYKPKNMPRQILWVLDEYISMKKEKKENDKEKIRKERGKGPKVELWIDNFKDVYYDPDYKLEEEKYGPTNWLLIEYDDGTIIDLNFSEIADNKLSSDELRNAYANAKIGKGGRLTPSVMNEQTTPRLWQAKQDALETQAWLTNQLIILSLGAVFFILTMGPQTVGRGKPSPSTHLRRGDLYTRHLIRSARLAQQLAEKVKADTGRVVVNLGGMRETPGAVNINILRSDTIKDPSKIPNLVRADAKDIGYLFRRESVDEIVSYNVEPGRISWPEAAQGAFKILKPNGKVFIAPYGSAETAEIASALQAAGFKTVNRIKLLTGEVVQAFKTATQ